MTKVQTDSADYPDRAYWRATRNRLLWRQLGDYPLDPSNPFERSVMDVRAGSQNVAIHPVIQYKTMTLTTITTR